MFRFYHRKLGRIISKKRIKISSCKQKARLLQQWVCQKISNLLDIPWGANEMIASREMGQSGTDVRLIGDALKRFQFSVECKRTESINIYEAIKQAQDNKLINTQWLVIHRKNNNEPIAILDAIAFFEILKYHPMIKPF